MTRVNLGFVYTVFNYVYPGADRRACPVEQVYFCGAFTDVASAKTFIDQQIATISKHLGPGTMGYGTLPRDELSPTPLHRGANTGDVIWTAHIELKGGTNSYGDRIDPSSTVFVIRKTPIRGSALMALAEAAE